MPRLQQKSKKQQCLLFEFIAKIKCFAGHGAAIAIFSVAGLGNQKAAAQSTPASAPPSPVTWNFAVSGDSRNCGDVVMPAIAAGAAKDHAAFYWHLGDLRKISDPDEDYRQEQVRQGRAFTINDYEREAWDDFVQNQIPPFGKTPFFLGIGNHETIPPKTRAEFASRFSAWLDQDELRAQRLKDGAKDPGPKTYYHWVHSGIDFIYLDNASQDQFDAAQMVWLEALLARDGSDASVLTVIIGMHEALPQSISSNHSMDQSQTGEETGRRVYSDLLRLQNESHKRVYVLASHSHYFMEGIFNTEYWRTHGGVLAGWIVGTGGAARHRLPPSAGDAKIAKTDVYGYLLGTANSDGEVSFQFKELHEDDIPGAVVNKFTQVFVHECFIANKQ